ncbi:MAG: Serine acetyltransferase [Verrucomicrobiaceae bacterium]|nr:Serine acetyltransferase [Verrucomicrobiaceae bacterium]
MDCHQEEIVNALIASYRESGGINHVDCGTNLPSKRAVASLCEDLLHLLFPGFFSDEALTFDELQMMTNELVASVRQRLSVEVRRSLRLKNGNGATENTREANDLVCQFLVQVPGVRKLLQMDVQAAYDGDPAAQSFEEIILAYPGLEAISIQRLAHVLYQAGVPLLPRMMTEWAHSRTGIDIHPGAQIGSHFFIDHGTGVVIGETAQIGGHVKLYQGVGLVARSLAAGQGLRGKKRHPTLEDHVTVYANATIVGGDTIVGRGSTIGASVFLMESVPENHVLALGDQELKLSERRKPRVAAIAQP